MKILLLMRHAKSDWASATGHDHERPLNPRGHEAAERMGRLLQRTGEIPDTVICSTATRARQTVDLAAAAGRWGCAVEFDRSVYAAAADTLMAVVRRAPEASNRLLLAGHEPGMSTLARLLGGAAVRFPTGAIACMALGVASWNDASPANATLIWFVPPRLVAGE